MYSQFMNQGFCLRQVALTRIVLSRSHLANTKAKQRMSRCSRSGVQRAKGWSRIYFRQLKRRVKEEWPTCCVTREEEVFVGKARGFTYLRPSNTYMFVRNSIRFGCEVSQGFYGEIGCLMCIKEAIGEERSRKRAVSRQDFEVGGYRPC